LQPKWQVSDLIDLEYFLNQTPNAHSIDAHSITESTDDLSADRKLYLSYEKTHQPPFTRRNLIKYWLEEKQRKVKKTFAGTDQTPGKAYTETVSLLRSLIIIISFISGAGLAWSVLSYSGTTPVNIFTCIWALIVPQFILMTILALSIMFSLMGFSHSFNGLYPLIAALLQRLGKWVGKRAKTAEKNFISADQRMHLHALTGLIGRQKTIYGSAFFWPVYILAQIFGVIFNLGILLALLLKLAITDLAFGWQSTLVPDPAIVYRMVDIFAWPWSWISSAHPTIEQIQGSRMILKEGMMHLTTPDLVSWWPFLCFSILCYGLLPRLVLLVMGLWQQNRVLKRVSFSTGTCDRLIQRMQTPHVQSAGRAYSSKSKPVAISVPTDTALIPTDLKTAILTNPAIVLVPEDIDGQFNDEDLNERIAHILGLKAVCRIRIGMDPTTDMTALDAGLSRNSISLEGLRIVILMEAWQPPIRESISWLNSLRNGLKKDTGIIIALIGKPTNQMIFTSPDNTDRVIWEKTVNSMGDPFMRVENIGG
jgi:hypothetical protein